MMALPTFSSLVKFFLLIFFFTLFPALIAQGVEEAVQFESAGVAEQSFGKKVGGPTPHPQITFRSPKAREFYVDGSKIPFVEFNAGPSYAGLLPVSDAPNESRKAFFWFWPANTAAGVNELTFWTNGGPGCSSLEGLLQENGPISWQFGQARPTPNPDSWTNLTSMLYVEHPIGTGYTQGTPSARDETDVSRDLFGFFKQWLRVFPEMKGKNFHLSGESYGGLYVPYLAQYIRAHQSELSLRLKNIYLVAPSLSYDVIERHIVTYPYLKRFEHVFALNASFTEKIRQLHKECGFESYLAKYHTYPPPPGPFPMPQAGTLEGNDANPHCALFDQVVDAARYGNKAFSYYHILDTSPVLWDVMDVPQRWPGMKGKAVYFDRDDVKRALHVPLKTKWVECSHEVFPNGDASLPSAVGSVLGKMLDSTRKTVIVGGHFDFVIPVQGIKLALQNVTWGHLQGFQKPITRQFVVRDQGSSGLYSTERGLTYVELNRAGHQIPQYEPVAAQQLLKFLLDDHSSSPSL